MFAENIVSHGNPSRGAVYIFELLSFVAMHRLRAVRSFQIRAPLFLLLLLLILAQQIADAHTSAARRLLLFGV